MVMLKLCALALLYAGVGSLTTKKKTFIRFLSGNVEDDVNYEEAFQIEFPEQMYDHCSDSFTVEAAYVKDPPKDKKAFCSLTKTTLLCRRRNFLIKDADWIRKTLEDFEKSAKLKWNELKLVQCLLSMLPVVTNPPLYEYKTTDLKSSADVGTVYHKRNRKPLIKEGIKGMKLKRTTNRVRPKKPLIVKTPVRPPKAVMVTKFNDRSNRVILPPKMKTKAVKGATMSKKKLRETKGRKAMRKEVERTKNEDSARKTEGLLTERQNMQNMK